MKEAMQGSTRVVLAAAVILALVVMLAVSMSRLPATTGPAGGGSVVMPLPTPDPHP